MGEQQDLPPPPSHPPYTWNTTVLTAWQRASPPSSSPKARWCGCRPGPPRPAASHPLWRANRKKKNIQHALSEVGLSATWKQRSGFDLQQVIHRHWHQDPRAAPAPGQLGNVRWAAPPWCCQTAKRLQKLFSVLLVNWVSCEFVHFFHIWKRLFLFFNLPWKQGVRKHLWMLYRTCLDRWTKSNLRKQNWVLPEKSRAHTPSWWKPFNTDMGFNISVSHTWMAESLPT